MRATFLTLVFVLLTKFVVADEIDNVVTNLAPGWHGGINVLIDLPETASTEQVLSRVFQSQWVDNGHVTNYMVLKRRQVDIPRAPSPKAYTDSYTAVLVQTSHGEKVALFRYFGSGNGRRGWWGRVLPYPPDLSPLVGGDPIFNWFNFPARRDLQQHLALVEVVSITNEHRSYTDSPNSKVSDDGGKTWYSLLNEWSGDATIKVIENPDGKMPTALTVTFGRYHYVHSRDETWTDWLVKPKARLLAFFALENGRWNLKSSFLDPVDYMSIPSYSNSLQVIFKTPLADEKSLADRKRRDDEARKRAQQQATNHIEEK